MGTPALKRDRVDRYDTIYAGADDGLRDRMDRLVYNSLAYMRKQRRRMPFGIGMAKELIMSMVDCLPPRGEGWAWETLNQLKGMKVGEVVDEPT